jgi:D-hydroxyproline dehydrogenase subunit beta
MIYLRGALGPMKPDVIVIGAGIVGAACAFELASSGLRVSVLDQFDAGGGVTAAGMGHLVLMDDSPAEFDLGNWSLNLWGKLSPRLSIECGFVRCGTLWTASDDDEYRLACERQHALNLKGVKCFMLDEHQLKEAEPALRHGLSGGMLVPDDAVVYAPAVAAWLLQQPVAGAIEYRRGTKVESVKFKGVRLSNGEFVGADAVVVANGLQASNLLPRLPLRAKKGHLVITDRYPGLVNHQLVELGYVKSSHHAIGTSVAFNVQPRPTGQLLIGSSRQFDTLDPAVEPAILARVLRHAASFIPSLAEANAIRAWTGFRPASADGLPLIGPAGNFVDPDARDTTWVAVGHEGLGVTTALATGRLIAAQITEVHESVSIDPAPYLPARFSHIGAVGV